MPQVQPSPTLAGSFRLFEVVGISVYVHWSWFLVAVFDLQNPIWQYTSFVWNVAEYLALFAIVLLHEFGHALACRQVGGRADEIVLWPLGGVAFVQPPARPGALLWSIAAGPLVNLVLLPITVGAYLFAAGFGAEEVSPDLLQFLYMLAFLNGVLLVFNILPIYPLDGGQIFQALLWFVVGRAKSLMIASIFGLIGAVFVIGGLAWWWQSLWTVIIGVFIVVRCISGFRQARILAQLETAPRHREARCPSCHAHPLLGPYWQCNECAATFDTFEHHGVCPNCHERFFRTVCPECTQAHHIDEWFGHENA